MAKLTKLILPLADVISPEKEALAEKWILREAYQLNCGVLQKQITKEKKDDVRQAMREKLLSHEESIRELNEFFKTAYFFPTEKIFVSCSLLQGRIQANGTLAEEQVTWIGATAAAIYWLGTRIWQMRCLRYQFT